MRDQKVIFLTGFVQVPEVKADPSLPVSLFTGTKFAPDGVLYQPYEVDFYQLVNFNLNLKVKFGCMHLRACFIGHLSGLIARRCMATVGQNLAFLSMFIQYISFCFTNSM